MPGPLAEELRGALAEGSDDVLELALRLERYVDALSRAVRGHPRAADHGLRRSVRDWFSVWDREVPTVVAQLTAAQDPATGLVDGPTLLALRIVHAAFDDASRSVCALQATVVQAEALWPTGALPADFADAAIPGAGLDAVIAAVRRYSEDLEYRMVAAEEALATIGQPADTPEVGHYEVGETGGATGETAAGDAGPANRSDPSLRLV